MKTRKAALVYSGQPRHLKECHANHWTTFYEANPNWELDVFGHIWHDDKWEEGEYRHTEPAVQLSKKDTKKLAQADRFKGRNQLGAGIKEFIKEHWRPKKIVFEMPRSFEIKGMKLDSKTEKPNPLWPNPINNALSMFYSMEQANRLKKEYEEEQGFKYDCVIRLRTDIYFAGPIGCCTTPIGCLDEYNLKKVNIRHVAPMLNYPSGAIDDQFAFADSNMMDKFTMVFTNIGSCIGNVDSDPHCLMNYHTKTVQGLPVEGHNWLFTLWRARNIDKSYFIDAEDLSDVRLKWLKDTIGGEIAARNEAAVRWLSGAADKKISIGKVSNLFCLYKDIFPESPKEILLPFKKAIKNNLKYLRYHPFEKVEKSLLSRYFQYKLQAELRACRHRLKTMAEGIF